MSERILVVEDDPGSLKFMNLVLTRKGGYQVVATESVILNVVKDLVSSLALLRTSFG